MQEGLQPVCPYNPPSIPQEDLEHRADEMGILLCTFHSDLELDKQEMYGLTDNCSDNFWASGTLRAQAHYVLLVVTWLVCRLKTLTCIQHKASFCFWYFEYHIFQVNSSTLSNLLTDTHTHTNTHTLYSTHLPFCPASLSDPVVPVLWCFQPETHSVFASVHWMKRKNRWYTQDWLQQFSN